MGSIHAVGCLYNHISFLLAAGGDYTPVTTELMFNSTNADVPQNVTIFILDDLLLEDSEYFNVTLTRPNSSAILTDYFTVVIEDEDSKLNCCYSSCVYMNALSRTCTVQFYLSPSYPEITIGFYCSGSYHVNENAGSVRVTVQIWRGSPARNVIVTLQTVNGSARGEALLYQALNVSAVASFPPYQSPAFFACMFLVATSVLYQFVGHTSFALMLLPS